MMTLNSKIILFFSEENFIKAFFKKKSNQKVLGYQINVIMAEIITAY